jgi:hypothetical protein
VTEGSSVTFTVSTTGSYSPIFDATNDATREPLPKIGDKVVVLVFKEGSGTLEDTHYLFQITKAA